MCMNVTSENVRANPVPTYTPDNNGQPYVYIPAILGTTNGLAANLASWPILTQPNLVTAARTF